MAIVRREAADKFVEQGVMFWNQNTNASRSSAYLQFKSAIEIFPSHAKAHFHKAFYLDKMSYFPNPHLKDTLNLKISERNILKSSNSAPLRERSSTTTSSSPHHSPPHPRAKPPRTRYLEYTYHNLVAPRGLGRLILVNMSTHIVTKTHQITAIH